MCITTKTLVGKIHELSLRLFHQRPNEICCDLQHIAYLQDANQSLQRFCYLFTAIALKFFLTCVDVS